MFVSNHGSASGTETPYFVQPGFGVIHSRLLPPGSVPSGAQLLAIPPLIPAPFVIPMSIRSPPPNWPSSNRVHDLGIPVREYHGPSVFPVVLLDSAAGTLSKPTLVMTHCPALVTGAEPRTE